MDEEAVEVLALRKSEREGSEEKEVERRLRAVMALLAVAVVATARE